MSELQISLLGIGALVIVAVFAYNKWQDRKIARGTNENFRSTHEDVLLKTQSRAPSSNQPETARIDATAQPVGASEGVEDARIEPVMSDMGRSPEGDATVVDDVPIDHFVEVMFAQAASADAILRIQDIASFPRVRWEEYAEIGGLWTPLRPGSHCVRIRAALQMVSRQGVIQQRDIELFETAVFNATQHLGGECVSGSIPLSLEVARELDAFCADVDVQIAIHLVSRDGVPFAGTKLRGLAEAAGMTLAPEGQFNFHNDDGIVLYSLANKEPQAFLAETMRSIATRGVSLLLDVPRAPGGVASFRAMVLLAQRLSQSLNAAILDDNGSPLGERAFDAIAVQLTALYRTMEVRGIAAGSPAALRLFS